VHYAIVRGAQEGMLNGKSIDLAYQVLEGWEMKRMLIASLSLVVLLGSFVYANAQTQPNLGGPVKVSTKLTYRTKVGTPQYGKFVTMNQTVDSNSLHFSFDITGTLIAIHLDRSNNGAVTTIMGCTPELIGNNPPRGKGLTFKIQGMAMCTFCPQSGVAGKNVCNDPSETSALGHMALRGTATWNNSTDQILTKLVLSGTLDGGGFQYTPAGSTDSHNAIITGTFRGTLVQELAGGWEPTPFFTQTLSGE
jgi:hypothetical protein